MSAIRWLVYLTAWLAAFVASGASLPETSPVEERILAEYPEYPEAANSFEKARILVDYAYRKMPWVSDGNSPARARGVEAVNRMRMGEVSLAETLKFFEEGFNGGSCAEVAHVTVELLREFGFEAWYLDVGFSPPSKLGSNFTHAAVLAKVDGGGGEIYSLFDPTVNATYVAADGVTPVDYFEFLKLLWNKDDGGVTAVVFPESAGRQPPRLLARMPGVEEGPSIEEYRNWLVDDNRVEIRKLGDGWWELRSPRTIEKLDWAGQNWWLNELVTEGWPRRFVYFFGLPFGIWGANGEQLQERAREVIARSGGPSPSEELYAK